MFVVRLAYFLLPKVIKNIVLLYQQNKTVQKGRIRQKYKVSKQYLNSVFEGLDLDADVFVHSSLMEIGKVEGGYKCLVELLNKNVIQCNHTLLFSALPAKGSSEDYIKSISCFDIRTASVAMGVINDYYSMLPNAVRSMSPTHSVVAVGGNAEYYVNEHHLSEVPFDENSPYFRIVKNNGKILMLGAGLKHLTLIHVVEDLLGSDFPSRIYTKQLFMVDVINKSGNEIKCKFRAHSKYRGLFRDVTEITNKIRLLPSTKILPLGASEIILMDAVDVVISLLLSLKNGVSAYGRCKLSAKGLEKANYWIDYFNKIKHNE